MKRQLNKASKKATKDVLSGTDIDKDVLSDTNIDEETLLQTLLQIQLQLKLQRQSGSWSEYIDKLTYGQLDGLMGNAREEGLRTSVLKIPCSVGHRLYVYGNCYDLEWHKRALKFLQDNDLLSYQERRRKGVKTGEWFYRNIKFKFVDRRLPKVKRELELKDFMDVNTGEWYDEPKVDLESLFEPVFNPSATTDS